MFNMQSLPQRLSRSRVGRLGKNKVEVLDSENVQVQKSKARSWGRQTWSFQSTWTTWDITYEITGNDDMNYSSPGDRRLEQTAHHTDEDRLVMEHHEGEADLQQSSLQSWGTSAPYRRFPTWLLVTSPAWSWFDAESSWFEWLKVIQQMIHNDWFWIDVYIITLTTCGWLSPMVLW